MKNYKHLLPSLLILSIFIGCSSERENIPNLENLLENYVDNGTPIMVDGVLFSGILFQEHNNGQILMEVHVDKGIPNGQFEYYFENGQLGEKGAYKDGKEDGLWELYYENGQLGEKGTYTDGELDGPFEDYYANGQLKHEGTYKDGQKEGQWVEHYEDGRIYSMGTGIFQNDVKISD